ncbi:MAG: AAA family ATPase [Bacteroidales bacterium]|nr:AAA family ATPase [Bacteroidales bacterium]
MKRVIVIGCPGTGKSTFARKLAAKTGLPLHYLDIDKTVALKDIASYLIITPDYLSRIRRKLAAEVKKNTKIAWNIHLLSRNRD